MAIKEYVIFCKKEDKENNENNANNENNDGEQYVMTFNTINKAVEFIKSCTLYEMIYKIYCIENDKKELVSIYKYGEIKHINNDIYYEANLKKTWQPITKLP